MTKFLLPVVFFLMTYAYAQYPAGSPVACHGRLHTEGYKLINENGQEVQLRGMSSHGLQWYGQFMTMGAIGTIVNDWSALAIRAAMYVEEGGYLSNPDIKNKVKDVVSLGEQYGIYVIIDWHVIGNSLPYKENAKVFFEEMANLYKDKKHIIYEIWNEPGKVNNTQIPWDDGSANCIKSYAQYIIPAIRAIDANNCIIVGTPNWCQYVDEAATKPLDPLTYTNVLYSLHIYSATHNTTDFFNRFQYASDKVPLFATEFGPSETDGAGAMDTANASKWLSLFAGKNEGGFNPGSQKVSWCNWSLCDKGETSAALKPGASVNGGWTDANLTESGKYIKNKLIKPDYINACDQAGPFLLTLSSTTGGTIQSSPPPNSGSKYTKGTIVTLTANATSGYSFVSWSGNIVGKQNPVSITMNGDKNVKAVFASETNLIKNGDFSNGTTDWQPLNSWTPAIATGSIVNGEYVITINDAGTEDWQIKFEQQKISLKKGKKYVLSFDAYASSPRQINPNVGQTVSPYKSYSGFPLVDLTTTKSTITLDFIMQEADDANARIEFNCGKYSNATVYLDNIILQEAGSDPNPDGPFTLNVSKTEGGNVMINPLKQLYNKGDQVTFTAQAYTGYAFSKWLGAVNNNTNPVTVTIQGNTNMIAVFDDKTNMIINGTFSNTDHWTINKNCGAFTSSVVNGQLEVNITDAGAYDYCVQVTQAPLNIVKNKAYFVMFDAYASSSRTAKINITMNDNPYTNYSNFPLFNLTTTKTTYSGKFISPSSDNLARLEMNLGKAGTGKVYFDNIVVKEYDMTDINSALPANELLIYPNPVMNGHFTIENRHSGLSGIHSITISDLQGRVIYNVKPADTDKTEISLPSSIQQGIYILSIRTGSTTAVEKIVIR